MLAVACVFAGCKDEPDDDADHQPPNIRNPNNWNFQETPNNWNFQDPRKTDRNKPQNLWDVKTPPPESPLNPNNPNNDNKSGVFKVYKAEDIKRTFADVAGLEEPKKALSTIADYLEDPVAFKRLGAEPPTGVIFYGPPGTGKTEMARAFAGEVAKTRKVSFIVASSAAFENKYVGVGADNVRKLFELARKNRPAIIFFDEFDALAGKRSDDKKNVQVVNQLLAELDGFSKEDRNDIFIIAATNLLSSIDPAIIRPGRIDRKIEIGLPNDGARKAVLEHYMALAPAITGIDIRRLVADTRGWSAAELKTLVNEARIHATINKSASITKADFTAALLIVRNGRRNP